MGFFLEIIISTNLFFVCYIIRNWEEIKSTKHKSFLVLRRITHAWTARLSSVWCTTCAAIAVVVNYALTAVLARIWVAWTLKKRKKTIHTKIIFQFLKIYKIKLLGLLGAAARVGMYELHVWPVYLGGHTQLYELPDAEHWPP